VAGVPHEVVGDEHPASLKRVQKCHSATFANERCGTIHLDHRQSSAGGCNGITLACVRLLSNPQCVQLGPKGAPIDYFGRSKFISHDVFHRSLRQRLGRCFHLPRVALDLLSVTCFVVFPFRAAVRSRFAKISEKPTIALV
jgi:hypothetical protein